MYVCIYIYIFFNILKINAKSNNNIIKFVNVERKNLTKIH